MLEDKRILGLLYYDIFINNKWFLRLFNFIESGCHYSTKTPKRNKNFSITPKQKIKFTF